MARKKITKNTGRKSNQPRTVTTHSGKTLKVNQSVVERAKAKKEEKARAKAAYLATLPKNPVKRFFYRLHPKRVAKFWFSKKGAILAAKIVGIGIIVVFILIVGVFAYFRKDLPKANDISGNDFGGSITYYDRSGQTVLWQDYEAVQRYPIAIDEMSDNIKNATVAIEDKNFYSHGAFDVTALARAAINNVTGGSTQGGSTISQQLVKLSQDWTEDRTMARKVKELILAVELERQYSKDDILQGYLNIAPYGGVEYGVEAASRNYFHKNAKDLTIAEAATLAAIPKSPDYYSPYSGNFSEEALVGRAHYIIDQMLDQKMITKEQAEEAKSVDVVATVHPRQPKYSGIQAPYFVLAAKDELNQKFGSETVKRGGWKVTTTLDLTLQAEAEKNVASTLPIIKRQGGDNAAFAAADVETGQMVALVGGGDFTNEAYGQINYAQTPLPPGSSFKPYDYAALIENSESAGAGSVIYDIQAPITGYPCTDKARPKDGGNCMWDYDFRYPGPMTIRYALGGSRNVPAVKAMLMTGVEKTIETAESMGLTSGYNCYEDEALTVTAPCYGSSALGDGAFLKLDEHVNAYGTFSRGGEYIDKTYLLKVVNAGGKAIYEWKQPEAKRAISADTAYIITDILSDPNASYMSTKIHSSNGWKFAVKTGTTNDAKDGLMLGYSTKYAAGVWVGYHDRSKEMTGFMETMTRPIWFNWMKAAHANIAAKNWEKPSTVKTEASYVQRTSPGGSARLTGASTDLYPAWYKAKTGSSQSAVIDRVSQRAATDCTPELARQTSTGGNTSAFSIDTFVDASSANTTATDDVHNCGDILPSISFSTTTCTTVNTACIIGFTVAAGTHPFSDANRVEFPGTLELYVNGQKVETVTSGITPGVRYDFRYTPTTAGQLTYNAVVIDSVLYSASGGSGTVTIH